MEKALENLNQYIQREGFRKERIAVKMGMSLSELEEGLANGEEAFAKKLASVFGYDLDYFEENDFSGEIEEPKYTFRNALEDLLRWGKEKDELELMKDVQDLIERYMNKE